jgi:DNA-binding MarR family transcriptional regulator
MAHLGPVHRLLRAQQKFAADGSLKSGSMTRKSQFWEVFCHMSQQPSHKDKTLRAFRAYIELLDAAEWFKNQLRAPLASFDLTMSDFRLLEVLHREGAQFVPDLARKRTAYRQTFDDIVERLEERGWVRRKVVRLPPVEFARSHRPVSERDEPRSGRRVNVVGLTRAGKKFFGNVLPSHSKLVKAFMRVLDGTEQDSLARLCRNCGRAM